ncbi:hypothetical protein [Lignipirellula cremea]|uniref:Uncharacterized protein n=1 Tax=Lignipirellula cremea TaxID=2528010 RepID=A0A518DLD8_9BACT|nr:hypothetical protein [Lignipirellula cremea]QDU92654.1 hypothetical protein Pla8534_04020 [Lignipirellula cremea]
MTHPRRPDRFRSTFDELNFLSDSIQIAMTRNESVDAIVALRFESLLESCGFDNGSIVLQEHWVTFYQMKQDDEKIIEHCRRQIELTEMLFALGGPVGSVDNSYLASALYTLADSLRKIGRVAEGDQARRRAEELDRR